MTIHRVVVKVKTCWVCVWRQELSYNASVQGFIIFVMGQKQTTRLKTKRSKTSQKPEATNSSLEKPEVTNYSLEKPEVTNYQLEKLEVTNFSNNSFSFSLYQKFLENFKGQNVVYSPYSIMSAMSMLLLGCEGISESELRSALSLNNVPDVHKAAKDLRERLRRESGGVVLHTANRLFPDKLFPIKDDYLNCAKEYYGSEVQSLDFRKNAEPSRKAINDWVYETTKQKIKDLIPNGSITADTALVLANAIYFKGTWMEQFDSEYTWKRDFHVNAEKVKKVDMMMKESIYNFAVDEKAGIQLLEIPYRGDGNGTTTSMLIALPVDRSGLEKMEKSLDATKLYALERKFFKEEVTLGLPKFKLEFNVDLVSSFVELGAPSIFSSNANLSGISESEELGVSAILHKAFIEVNEEGTEAAAATAVEFYEDLSMPIRSLEFICDHPFQFFIKHKPTNTILFAGRYVNPE